MAREYEKLIQDSEAKVQDAVDEWVSRNEPIHGADFRKFAAEIAASESRHGSLGHRRLAVEGTAEELGELAAKWDLALVELTDGANYGVLYGIWVDHKHIVPVLALIDKNVYAAVGADFDILIQNAQNGIIEKRVATDGSGLEKLSYTKDVPPANIVKEERWFCMREYKGNKVPAAPWIDEDPDGEKTSWDQPVGHNWPGVKTDYETAGEWASKTNKLFLATRIDHYEDRDVSRIHLFDFDNVRDPDTGEIHPTVSEFIDKMDSYAQISYSGTGIHVYASGPVPEGKKKTGFEEELCGWKHEDKFEEGPHVEGYSRSRFIAITENHIDKTPETVEERPDVVEWVYEKWAEDAREDPPEGAEKTVDREPTHTKTEVRSTKKTSDWDIVFDAIAHAKPSFANGGVRLRSTVTNERASGIVDLDPSWEHSESGSRLGYDDGFIYRKSDTGLDILQVVALEERIITSVSEYPQGEKFHDAVEALRERGAHIPEYEPEGSKDPVSVLPLERLDSLPHQDRKRFAKKRGIQWPTVNEVRDGLVEDITESMADGDTVVQSAPTGAGKTHTVASQPWISMTEVTGEKPVVHTHRTREARDQAKEMSDDAGVDSYVLKGRKELCPVAAGAYDPGNPHGNAAITIDGQPVSEWIDHLCDRQGIPFVVAHRWAEELVDGDLPCNDDSQCAALGQFEGIPRDDRGNPSHDVIHATQQFLNVPSLRMHTHVIIDEKPSFGIGLNPEEVRRSVNAYLRYIDAPVDSYSELVEGAKGTVPGSFRDSESAQGVTKNEMSKSFEDRMDDALNGDDTWVECPECKGTGNRKEDGAENEDLTAYPEHGGATASNACVECDGRGQVVENRGEPPLEWYRDNPEAHSLAPAFARAIWQAEESAGSRKHGRVVYRPPRWGNDDHDSPAWNRVYVDVVLNDQWEVIDAERIPDFSLAASVIGLDAHPQPADPFWQANVHNQMRTNYTLSEEERTLYRRYERGLFTVQIGDGVQPVTTGEWLEAGQGRKFKAAIRHLADHYGDDFDSAITSMSAKGFVRDAMVEAGVDDPDMMHYGNEESRNDFAGKDVGLVVGSIDPGDATVMNLCARLGYDVEPAHKECPVCGGDGHVDSDETDTGVEMCETCGGAGDVRERGRTFHGEDAEMADAVLQGVREHHVAQSAGRWARDADDPDDHATVFIISEASPDGFIDAKTDGVTWVSNEDQQERLEYVRDNPGVTTKEIAEATGCAKTTARRTMEKAEERGIIERTPGKGPYGADLYYPGDDWNPYGGGDLGKGTGSRQLAYRDYCTWTVAIEAEPHRAVGATDANTTDWGLQSTFEWFEPVAPPS